MTPDTVAVGMSPQSMNRDPNGYVLYVANYGEDTVSQFTIGGTGQLTAVTPGSVATGAQPVAVAVTAGPSQ